MNYIKKLLIIIFVSIFSTNLLVKPYFVDFKYILNESKAGKEAQDYLKKLNDGIKNLKKKRKLFKMRKKNYSTKK